jgi:hypothetical protein
VALYIYAKRTNTPLPLQRGGSAKTEVRLLRPGYRYVPIPVKESAKKLDAAKVGGVERRFYKFGRGWDGPQGLMFFAVEGNAYTKIIRDASKGEEVATIPEFLRYAWTDQVYDAIKPDLKARVEAHSFGVTISPNWISDEDSKLPRVSEEDVNSEDSNTIKKGLKGAVDEGNKLPLTLGLLFALGGGFVVYILCNIHLLPVVVK